MASKKYVLLMASLMVFFQTISFAQTADWGWNWKDSSKIPTQRIPQYNEFLNNQFPYPAQPRDQWELGIGLGVPFLSSDLNSKAGFGGTVTLRKALNHTFSLRPYFSYFSINGSKKAGAANPPLFPASYDYKHTSSHIGLNVLTSLNTASYYRGNPKVNIYLITGFELWSTKVQQDLLGNGNYTTYDPSANKNLLSATSTSAMSFGVNVGGGAAIKISNKVNLAFEAINTLTNYDYLEGYSNAYSNAFDAWWYGGLKLNINLGNPAKRVQPLYWINPNNYAYSELNSPKHMKLPKVVLPDADGDGVTDQFDLEPNTPAGAPVDSHGVSKDTDGDGVPDYRDKELLTPQKCFPVNNDGVGTCPEPACCKELRDQISNLKLAPAVPECTLTNLPSIHFKSGVKLSKDAEKILAAAAANIKANPNCKVKVIGHPAASKAAQQLSYERVSAVIKYLVEKQGIAENRFIFNYDGGNGDAATIDLQGTNEEGPNTVPSPHPNLKTKG
jgi:outer membrane protein OmpA-like peptidoglycan-associated protein